MCTVCVCICLLRRYVQETFSITNLRNSETKKCSVSSLPDCRRQKLKSGPFSSVESAARACESDSIDSHVAREAENIEGGV